MVCQNPEEKDPCDVNKLSKIPKGLVSEKLTDLLNDIIAKLNCELFSEE